MCVALIGLCHEIFDSLFFALSNQVCVHYSTLCVQYVTIIGVVGISLNKYQVSSSMTREDLTLIESKTARDNEHKKV
jgi:hypothetical protein